jgi:anti-sigma factor RsiW
LTETHVRELLGAYTLDALGPDEKGPVRDHLESCAECRQDLHSLEEPKDLLHEVPPEAFLNGPPEGGDLLLQRTLRAVRQEKARTGRSRFTAAAAGIVALVAVAGIGGVMAGRRSAGDSVVAQPPPVSVSIAPPGTHTVTAADPATGAKLTATIQPAIGWVRIHAMTTGIKAGTPCQLIVTDKNGKSLVAGSWLVSPQAESNGTAIDGAALIPAADLSTVQVMTTSGEKLVTANA